MARGDGSLAPQLDFREHLRADVPNRRLRLAVAGARLRGPDKYKVLEHRRRQAQIRARRLLDLLD